MPEETDPTKMALDDPELMRIWGLINAGWDNIESLLYAAFDSMIDDSEHVTRAIFYSQKNQAARRDMVESLAKYFFRDNETGYGPLKNAINRVKARSQARNELAHGDWAALLVGGAPAVEVVRTTQKPSIEETLNSSYDKAALKRVADDMADTAKVLKEAVEPLKQQKLARRPPTKAGWVKVPRLLP